MRRNINPLYEAAIMRAVANTAAYPYAVARNAYREFGPETRPTGERAAVAIGGPLGMVIARSLKGTGSKFKEEYRNSRMRYNMRHPQSVKQRFDSQSGYQSDVNFN